MATANNGVRRSLRAKAAKALTAPTGANTENTSFIKLKSARDAVIPPPVNRTVESYPAAVADAARIAQLSKNIQKNARAGQFAWQETHFNGERLTSKEVENAYRLAHWNASHEAAASGLIAEGPAVEAGIKKFFDVPSGNSRAATANTPQTTRYQKGGLKVDVVDCFTMKDRNAGINPLSFIFNEVIPLAVMPWELTRGSNNNWSYRGRQLSRRTADATYFQKGRVDMNLLKIWCGATSTVDVRRWKAATVPTTMELTDAQGKSLSPRQYGALGEPDIRKLESGKITGLGIGGDSVKNEALKRLMKTIFENEKSLFAKDCKGPLDVESDLRIHKKTGSSNNRNAQQVNARWAANARRNAGAGAGAPVGEEVAIGESKVSDGPTESYPGEAIQLLKANLNDCLYYQCSYGDRASPELVQKTTNFFAAYGIGAMGSTLRFTSLFKGPGQVSDTTRRAGLVDLAAKAKAVWPGGDPETGAAGVALANGKICWPVARLGLPKPVTGREPTHSISNANAYKYFPYCNYSTIWTYIKSQRAVVEGKLRTQIGKWEAARWIRLLSDETSSDAALFEIYVLDALETGLASKKNNAKPPSPSLANARVILSNIVKQLRIRLGRLANGMKLSGMNQICELGGDGGPISLNRQLELATNKIGMPGLFQQGTNGSAYYKYAAVRNELNNASRATRQGANASDLTAASQAFQAAEILRAFIFIQLSKFEEIGQKNVANRELLVLESRVYPIALRSFARRFILGYKMLESGDAQITPNAIWPPGHESLKNRGGGSGVTPNARNRAGGSRNNQVARAAAGLGAAGLAALAAGLGAQAMGGAPIQARNNVQMVAANQLAEVAAARRAALNSSNNNLLGFGSQGESSGEAPNAAARQAAPLRPATSIGAKRPPNAPNGGPAKNRRV